MSDVNKVAKMFGCNMGEKTDCPVDADINGTVRDPATTGQLCDRIIADDAILKLRLAAQNLRKTGQPFFMAAGFRKPHLDFRFPRPMLDLLPPEETTDVATHPTLHPSQPPIAHFDAAPQANPFKAVDNATARQWRLFYRAAVAWVDSQIGRVLEVLKSLDLEDSTMVVLHSDHGWSLGEHGEWEKFTNFEHGTRVPLIISVPWIPESSKGARTKVLAELVDIFPTMTDALDVPMKGPEKLDGTSLLPVLKQLGSDSIARATKPYALSQYHRCPPNVVDPSQFWKKNDCDMVDRSQFPFVGYTIRTHDWRYTEWVHWDAAKLEPDWSKYIASELYSHDGDDGFDFNAFENYCENDQHPQVVADLSNLLHSVVKNQTRLWHANAANTQASIVV
jgi:arylsulfatase A-like enzyme